MKSLAISRVQTMLRSASSLDKIGKYASADILSNAAHHMLKKISQTNMSTRIPADSYMEKYMDQYKDYFGEPTIDKDGSPKYYTDQYDDIDHSYVFALKNNPTAIDNLRPSELKYWHKRQTQMHDYEPNHQTWDHLKHSFERGTPEYDHYLRLLSRDPVYENINPDDLINYVKSQQDQYSRGDWSNPTDWNVAHSLLRAANHYLIHDNFDYKNYVSDIESPYNLTSPLNQQQVDDRRALNLVMERDKPMVKLPPTEAYRLGDGSLIHFNMGRRDTILRHFTKDDVDKPYDELIARSLLSNDKDIASEKLNSIKEKMKNIYRMTPENTENYYHYLKVFAMYPNLIGTSLKNIDEIVSNLNEGQDGSNDMGRLMVVFNKNWRQWVAKFNNDVHEAAQILPMGSTQDLRGLGDLLMQWYGKVKTTDLYTIASYWPNLTAEDKSLPIDQLADRVRYYKVRQLFKAESINHPSFAIEAAKWWQSAEGDEDDAWLNIDEDDDTEPFDYENIEKLFIDSQNVPLPVWASYTASIGGLTGRFLPRSDVRGLFLGQYSNSCQHPWGVGASCAIHGQTSPHGAFFVVEDQKGNIIAQSWVWEDYDGDVVFDNVEALGIGDRRMPIVQSIYKTVAEQMEGRIVHIGTGGSDLDLEPFKDTDFRLAPNDYYGYRDSTRQKILADNTY